jgi:hypothetical protein
MVEHMIQEWMVTAAWISIILLTFFVVWFFWKIGRQEYAQWIVTRHLTKVLGRDPETLRSGDRRRPRSR